ncbi:hypothetical protein C6A37_08905, partial [Desulfobacteraceae bacterium SEEP-SAG9]
QINIILGNYYFDVNENYHKALEYFKKALKVGKELDDIISIVLANMTMGCCLSDDGEFEKALSCLEKALEINTMANVPWGIVGMKTHITIGVYVRQGNIELAHQTSQEALRIADESGDLFSKGYANFACGGSYYCMGFLDKAEEHLLRAVYFLEKSNLLGIAAFVLGFMSDTYLYLREYEKSQKFSERAISLWQHSSMGSSYIKWNKIIIALAKVMNNEK